MIKKNAKIWWHIMAWAILFLLPIIFAPVADEGTPKSVHATELLLWNTLAKVFWVLVFYLNTVVLISKFLYYRRYFLFVLAQILLFLAIIGMHALLFEWVATGLSFRLAISLVHNIIPFLFTVLVSIAYKTVADRINSDRMAREKQQETLKTELSFLRSQISPHFLFNVLNNIVALVRLKSEELEPTILKLSSLMQYMLYETDDEKVLLKSEVDYLRNYIDLQQLRFGKRLNLNFDVELTEDWHVIEPMLLIPFVENAFKHGTGMIENPVIDISLKAANNELFLTVKNKYIETDEAKDKVSGIGMSNVKRRLELLYGKKHNLTIDKTKDRFIVILQLTLESQ